MLPGPSLPRRRPRRPPQLPPQLLWQMNAELSPQPPPPCLWMVPSSGGLLRLAAGVVPPPLLLPSPPQPPPLLPGVPSWQVPCEPSFLPLVPVPSAAPDPPAPQFPLLNEQWMFGAQSPVIGFSPSSNVDLIPIIPHVYTSALPPPVGKSWLDKRIPNCKIYLNNTFALDSTWIHPEESRLFHGHEKPHLMTNQVAVALSRPAPASRHLPTVVLTPQPIPVGCSNGLKQVGSHPTIAITSTAMVSVEPEGLRGPSASTVQPCHLLTLAPIKIPLLTAPFSGAVTTGDKEAARIKAPSYISNCQLPPSFHCHHHGKAPELFPQKGKGGVVHELGAEQPFLSWSPGRACLEVEEGSKCPHHSAILILYTSVIVWCDDTSFSSGSNCQLHTKGFQALEPKATACRTGVTRKLMDFVVGPRCFAWFDLTIVFLVASHMTDELQGTGSPVREPRPPGSPPAFPF
ncbi:transcription elongation regulator 1-like protein [Petaurus breviceps papuanus]|uniref:transcription elongation regulator 1-like protein n=1 Tax=Petaurus breviceps papuanus TaxID=3040969 RepID=UPI0036D7D30D